MYALYRKMRNLIPTLLNRLTFKRKHIIWPAGLTIWGVVRMFGRGKIEIGEDVTINSCIEANPTRGGILPLSCIRVVA